MQYFFILGNHPRLSLAEIAAVLEKQPVLNGSRYAVFEVDPKLQQFDKLIERLGGVIKIGQVLAKTNQEILIKDILSLIQNQYGYGKGQKIFFGISAYGIKLPIKDIGLTIKKNLKEAHIPSRLVTSSEDTLSSVIVKTNKLLTNRGCEIVVLNSKDNLFLSITRAVQPFEELSKRDYGRPYRDAASGMLPPKLARIMINLARLRHEGAILDPFCGMGTILQEALLMGYQNIIGSDIDTRALSAAKANLAWIRETSGAASYGNVKILESDVRNISKKLQVPVEAIVSEPYLGPPLKGREHQEKLRQISNELIALYYKSFQEFRAILKKDGRVVVIFPALHGKPLEILPYIKQCGFIQDSVFNPFYDNQKRQSFLYARAGQLVKREIFVFRKK